MPEQLQSTISATFAQIKVTVPAAGAAAPPSPNHLTSGGSSGIGEQIKLQLWDTAGDEKLRHVTRNYYNGASAACIVYDVTSRESLEVAREWIESVR